MASLPGMYLDLLLHNRVRPEMNTGETFCTIQAAINDAQTAKLGNVISVSAGTFAENVTINKSITLKGANFGTAGCSGGRVAESIIAGGVGTAITIAANGVTVDGFEITGITGVSSTGYTNIGVRNNKITATAVGVSASTIATSTGNTYTIEDNCIDLTTQVFASTNTSIGIFVNGASGTASLLVDDNTVHGFYGYVINGVNTTPASVLSGWGHHRGAARCSSGQHDWRPIGAIECVDLRHEHERIFGQLRCASRPKFPGWGVCVHDGHSAQYSHDRD